MRPAADMPGEAEQLGALQRELLRSGRDAHRLYREVEALRDRLDNERMEREELVAVVSHELRTPLTVIGGFLKLLLSEQAGPLNADQRRFIEESRRSVGLLDAFVERVVEGTRSGRSGEVLEVACGPVAPVIEAVAGSFEQLLEERGSSLALSLTPGLEARFDAGAVERVLTNLIDNAVRHAKEGGPIEVATRGAKAEGRSFVEIAVSDDGPGVAAGDRERIFEPYVQAAQAGRRRGLGLGLAICRRLVEAHGGSIRVEDGPAGGSRFVFTLPRAGA
jgi:signal transduction histidine kinase